MNSEEKTDTCARVGCNCAPTQEGEYCSQHCQDAAGDLTASCRCGHPGCEQRAHAKAQA